MSEFLAPSFDDEFNDFEPVLDQEMAADGPIMEHDGREFLLNDQEGTFDPTTTLTTNMITPTTTTPSLLSTLQVVPESFTSDSSQSDAVCPPKKTSPVRRGRKKKDPNAPSPPMSAYLFFFKEMQATVKSHNPEAKFGEVSKIVASMWDTLDDDAKSTYRQRNETDKLRYKREMAAYKATGLTSNPVEDDDEYNDDDDDDDEDDPEVNAVFKRSQNDDSVTTLVNPRTKTDDVVTDHVCLRKGCTNNAVRNSEWEDEYCSNDCVVMHCGNVFAEWICDQQAVNAI